MEDLLGLILFNKKSTQKKNLPDNRVHSLPAVSEILNAILMKHKMSRILMIEEELVTMTWMYIFM